MLIKLSEKTVTIPEGVQGWVKNRKVVIKGPRGILTKDFKHLALDMSKKGEKQIEVKLHFGNRKNIACVRTVCSHIENMITGVTKGFRYKMRLVYSHFPIGAVIDKDGMGMHISNFLGQKRKRYVKAWEGVKITSSADVKDELIFEGNSLDAVSGTCAAIKDSVLVREKDIRKFLDGIYVSEKGTIVQEE